MKLNITHLGGLGDGVAQHDGQSLFVPYSCPGDVIEAKRVSPNEAKLEDIIHASSQRTEPPCRHFGSCGGCALQHINAASYRAFKQGILERIVAELGCHSTPILPLLEVGAAARRRVELKVARRKKKIEMGFLAAKSHQLIAIEECPVIEPAILSALPALKQGLMGMKKPSQIAAIQLTLLENGLDIVLVTSSPLKAHERLFWAKWAEEQQWLRLAEKSDEIRVLYDSSRASVRFGSIDVALPVGAFLQATQTGEQAITHFVTKHLAGCGSVVDLYAGCGTYSFPLMAQSKRVTAYEGADEMVAAMYNAILQSNREDTMRVEARDLYHRPLSSQELMPFDGAVINPPRNGALPQVKQLAQSSLNKIVMVSCNPLTFQRDAKALLAKGYVMVEAQAIDQFTWTGHLEVVAAFRRD